MAHRGFSGAIDKINNKQCQVAHETHLECLNDYNTQNDYICKETFEAYKRWCPSDVRARLSVRDFENRASRELWGSN